MEKDAIITGFKNLGDWLFGMNGIPLYTLLLKQNSVRGLFDRPHVRLTSDRDKLSAHNASHSHRLTSHQLIITGAYHYLHAGFEFGVAVAFSSFPTQSPLVHVVAAFLDSPCSSHIKWSLRLRPKYSSGNFSG